MIFIKDKRRNDLPYVEFLVWWGCITVDLNDRAQECDARNGVACNAAGLKKKS